MSDIDPKTLRTVAAGVVGGVIGGTLGIVPIAGWLIGGIAGGVVAALVADRLSYERKASAATAAGETSPRQE